MDWFSWLSKTSLEPFLIYEYGLTFARNELEAEDLADFNHEFLQSIGISIAKHRLEILKLAKKEIGSSPAGLSRLVYKAKKRIKRCIRKLGFPVNTPTKAATAASPKVDVYQGLSDGTSVALFARNTSMQSGQNVMKEVGKQFPGPKTRRIAKSGPLDRRLLYQDNLMVADRNLRLSGPLDGKIQEKLVLAYRSPKLNESERARNHLNTIPNRSPQLLPRPNYAGSRPPSPRVYGEIGRESSVKGDHVVSDADQSLWVSLFQDMKPT